MLLFTLLPRNARAHTIIDTDVSVTVCHVCARARVFMCVCVCMCMCMFEYSCTRPRLRADIHKTTHRRKLRIPLVFALHMCACMHTHADTHRSIHTISLSFLSPFTHQAFASTQRETQGKKRPDVFSEKLGFVSVGKGASETEIYEGTHARVHDDDFEYTACV